jgi:flagellar biosynthesis GTPase FlhF
MMLRKFYGRTIQEAMRDARQQLGNDVVLIESSAPEGDRPASVTVMLERKEEPGPIAASEESSFRNILYSRSAARPKAAVEAPATQESARPAIARRQPEPDATSKSSTALPGRQPAPRKDIDSNAEASSPQRAQPPVKPAPTAAASESNELPEPKGLDESMSRRKTPLIEIRDHTDGQGAFFRDPGVNRDLAVIHKRLDKLESMLGDSLISANLDYASHTAFQQLIHAGVRATTVASWFKQLLSRGIDPYEQHESFMFELARLVRDAISVALPQAAAPNMLFTGPSGSGKTTLIMKLATSEQFFKERKVALVSVEPRGFPKKYSGLEAFAKDSNIDFYRIQDGIEISRLMPTFVQYDQVLFDSPSISLEKNTAFREYWKIRQILASVLPLEVHYVVNATLEQFYFREAYAASHPLQPDYISITHLDETQRWGQLIPFIKTMGCAIRYISLGQEIPGSIAAFSPTWFAEKILSMGERA